VNNSEAVEILANEADTSERLAIQHCNRGDHRQAAWRFEKAGDYYRQADMFEAAARCYAQAYLEARWVRPVTPTNVSGLVD